MVNSNLSIDFFFKVKRQVFLTLLIFFHFQKSIMASSLMASVIFKTSLRLSVSRLFYRTSPRYFIIWVLSNGQVRLDLWCKDQNIPFENSCSTTIFLYFNLKLKTFFYKQCWPYIQKIFFEKIFHKKYAILNRFVICYVINCMLLKREHK